MSTEKNENNLLPLVKDNNLMEILPKCLNVPPESFQITPSEFIREMNLTTEERHKMLLYLSNTKKIISNAYPPELRVLPHILVFQRFEARSTNTLILQIRNMGKSLLPLKMYSSASVYFSANFSGIPVHKIAPGLCAEYKITFTPKDAKDYSHHLVFSSKDIVFSVPIIAIGPRAIFDIPDRIIFNTSPVKLASNKCIVVRNIGTRQASYNFITQRPFSVSPAKGLLNINESALITITFESSTLGEATETLFLYFETGEKIVISLQGTTENINVRLDKNSIMHDDTYIGLSRCKSVRLCNNSSNAIKFSWKKNSSIEEDLNFIKSMKEKFTEITDNSIFQDAKVKYYELCDADSHEKSCKRILEDELNYLQNNEFSFSHEAFTMTPQQGEIFPKGSAEIIVMFQPKIPGTFIAEAFLEVSGRDSRFSLQMKGTGLGPKIVVNPQTLDVDFIYLCSLHNYEIIVENKGDIPGRIQYVQETSVFGGKITVTPNFRRLNPGEFGVFIISFTSNKQGEFVEQIKFKIIESNEVVSFIFKGKIICPTLHFDTRRIDFGVTSLGFPTVRVLTLNNLSMVPVSFSLKVLNEGNTRSLSYTRFASFAIKPSLPISPKEFYIDPEESVVEPYSSKTVTLTLTSNRVGRFNTQLVAEMWDSESSSVSCPISFNSRIPTIVAEPGSITIPFCFINYPYTRTLTLRNLSKVDGFFCIVPINANENSNVTCSPNLPQGVIERKSSIQIEMTVITSALGKHSIPVNLLILGYEEIHEVCRIACTGQGPVVTLSNNSLHWGEQNLLEESQKTLIMSNESPIPATVSLSVQKDQSPWTVSQTQLTLDPSEAVPVTVSLYLADRGRFASTLRICVHNGKVLNVALSAIGVGSSLNIVPKIVPSYDFGILFSRRKYIVEVQVENKSKKIHNLVWSPFPDYNHFMSMKFINPANLIFKIEPTRTDLLPEECKTIVLEVQGFSTGQFEHTFYCFASIGSPTRDLHLTFDVFAEFVEPLISFNKPKIEFWLNLGQDENEEKLKDEVIISNVSVLKLEMLLSVHYPFYICNEYDNLKKLEVHLNGNESKIFGIKFKPDIKDNKISRKYNDGLTVTFKEHSKKFILPLNGEVNYPNIFIVPRNIQFNYIPLGVNAFHEIKLVNISPLTVYFKILWDASSSSLTTYCKSNEPNEEDTENSEECFGENYGEFTKREMEVNIETKQSVSPNDSIQKMPTLTISKSDIKKVLFPLANHFHDCNEDLMSAYRDTPSINEKDVESVPEYANVCLKKNCISHPRSKTQDKYICDITPFRGKLEKFTSQVLSVRFSSDCPLEFHVNALVEVLSGPTENIIIDGIAGEIDFHLSTTVLDFGKFLFSKTSTQFLKIQNKGYIPFAYETITTNACTIANDYNYDYKGSLTISPAKGTAEKYSTVRLKVSFTPGSPGEFENCFFLQIAHLNPICIKIKGIGVFPQVYVNLPRNSMLELCPELCYLATANISPDWLLQRSIDLSESPCAPSFSHKCDLDMLSNFTETSSFEFDWEFINASDCLPTDIDIQLAIERHLAYNLNKNLSFAFARSIPQFIVPSYELDLGNCIIGKSIECKVWIKNYGPVVAVVYGVFDQKLKENGINIRLKNKTEILVGESSYMSVIFSPKKSRYNKKIKKIENFFYLEVNQGALIPIKILATVTYPYIVPSIYVLNYFDVICGRCKVMNLKFYNPGLVPAAWSLIFQGRDSESQSQLLLNKTYEPHIFHSNYKSGVLVPDEYCSVQITFKPDCEANFGAVLWVKVEYSLEKIKIVLLGEGVEPKINISQNLLEFGPITPYPNRLDKYFTIDNPCSFPVEFYFPSYDEQIFEEDKILRALCLYYQSNEILLPVRKPGDGLPSELISFYQMLLENLNAKFIEDERNREADSLEESMYAIMSSEDDIAIHVDTSISDKKVKKLKNSISRTRASIESSLPMNSSTDILKDNSIHSIFTRKTSVEIEEMLQEYIKELLTTNPTYDPVQAALKNTIPTVQVDEYRQGLLIIFHGAPFLNSAELANRAALTSGLLAINIDQIILEEAAFARCEVGLTARELIEEAYWNYVEIKPERAVESDEMEAGSEDFAINLNEIERKFSELVNYREKLTANKGKIQKSASAKSEGSRKEKDNSPLKTMDINAPIANITEELALEILKFRLHHEVKKGIVIESLSSVFFNTSLKALTSVLKAAGNITEILTIFLLSNYIGYTQTLLNAQLEIEKSRREREEQILNTMEEESVDDIELLNMNESEFQKFWEIFLGRRHKAQELYALKKECFYEYLKKKILLKIAGNDDSLVKCNFSTSVLQNGNKDDMKKETNKGAKASGGKPTSESKGVKTRKDSVETEFASFETELVEIRALVENWDQRIGAAVIDNVQDVKMKKGQTPRKIVETPRDKPPPKGIHLWLVDMNRPETELFRSVCNYLKTTLENRYIFREVDQWPLKETESIEFSVVSFPPPRTRPDILDVYSLSPYEVVLSADNNDENKSEGNLQSMSSNAKISRSVSQISFKGKRRACITARRKKSGSRTSLQSRNQISKKPATSRAEGIIGINFKSRWVLQPQETLTWRVRYFPMDPGQTIQEYPINLTNWRSDKSVCCIGRCDIPTINMTPEVMFSNIISVHSLLNQYYPSYFYSENALNFGPIVNVYQNDERKSLTKSTTITLINTSQLPVDLIIALNKDSLVEENNSSPHLTFDPENVYLKPGEMCLVNLAVSPVKFGQVAETLMLFIKDNPKVELINIKFEGIKPNVSIEPKAINFDRILLHRKERRDLFLTNSTETPLYFVFTNLSDLPTQFRILETSGWISPQSSFKTEIFYEAVEIQQIIEMPIIVKVFDDLSMPYPVLEIPINFSVEAYDVALDVIFSEPEDDHIDFGQIRIQSECSKVFNLRNTGKYLLGFWVLMNTDVENNLSNTQIFISPQEGKLQPGKIFPITISLFATSEIDWRYAQIFRISLVEPYKGDELIATIPIMISVKSSLPVYEIVPKSEFNFGHVKIGTLSSGTLTIENKGHFPLSYSVQQKLEEFVEAPETSNKKSSKPSASSKEKEDKKANFPLKIGPYEISPSSGTIDTDQRVDIKVTCLPLSVERYEEIIVITINENPSHFSEKNEIYLRTQSCLPSIDFNDCKSIFREHFILKNESDLNCSSTKFEPYTIFTENNFTFSFKNACLCKTSEAQIHIPNSGVIDCHIRANVSCIIQEESHSGINISPPKFDVFPKELIIEPYSYGTLTLTFQPESIEEYRAQLLIILSMPNNYDDIVYTLSLFGFGVLPQVEITKPTLKLPEGQVLVNFPPTTPKRFSSTSIAFSNRGVLKCKVVLEIVNNQDRVFTLIPKSDTEKMLKSWELAKFIDHTVVIEIFPNEVAEFTAVFSPQETKSYSSQIKLFVIDNPFENLSYSLTGEGYFEEVLIERIRTTLPFLDDDEEDYQSLISGTPGHYILNFNDCYVKKETKAFLRLLNKTQKDYFKFEWEEMQGITVSPNEGHLFPKAYKEILIVFCPEEPMELDEMPLVCTLNKIAFSVPPAIPSWDSRISQKPLTNNSLHGDTPNTNLNLRIYEEPKFELIPESTKTLCVLLSGIADFARLSCDITSVTFKNTFMFQTRMYPLILENCGSVALEYKLILTNVTALPVKITKMTQVEENSFSKSEKSQGNSRTLTNSSSNSSTCVLSKSVKNNRPRSLTSVSLLNMKTHESSHESTNASCEVLQEHNVINYNPFVLENSTGKILPKEKATCNIIFAPMDINEYKASLLVQVPNLHPDYKIQPIQLTAFSLMPYCHFNIPESDYLENGRRDYSLPGPVGFAPGLPLHPDTKTIEIKVLGIGQTVPIKFHVINPTEDDYTFAWVNVTQIQPDIVQSFHCSTLDGRIQAGRQQQMVFSFVSQRIGITESFWKFVIPEYNVETPFLLVSDVREPSVYFLSTHIHMTPNFIGSTSTDTITLINQEKTPFEFHFLPDSLYSEGRLHILEVDPPSGKVPGNSEFHIRVSFFGKTGGKVLFYLKCKVKCIKEIFTISVEAMTYVVQPLVIFEDLKKIKHHADVEKVNLIDFGTELTPNRPETMSLILTSVSKTSFYYEWWYDRDFLESRSCKLKFSVKNGHVSSFGKDKCDLSVTFMKKSSIINFPVKLKISRGPIYNFVINAKASTPSCEFSFTNYDFGYCFIQEKDICYYEVPLLICNNDVVDFVIEAYLPETSSFSYRLSETTVQPGQEIIVNIYFHPKEIMSYSDELKFTINSLHEKIVIVRGSGTEFKVTLENADDTTIHLGAVKKGKSCSCQFSLINKSFAPANILVGFADQLPVPGICMAKPNENRVDLSKDHRLSDIITLSPSSVFTIKPREVYKIDILYTPQKKSNYFSETVSFQFQEKVEPLCVLTGCCIGLEVSLDRTFINFGAVVQDCSSTMKVKLLNSGSIGTKFEWLTSNLDPDYNVFPVVGYSSPESEVTINITFHPTEIGICKKAMVQCKLHLTQNETCQPLILNLTGDCVCLPQPNEVINFKCFVRETDNQTIKIENQSGNEWQLLPVFSGEYFSGCDGLVIPSLQSADYVISYNPLLMTAPENPHLGSVFFRLPNGQGLLYKLQGIALAPPADDIIEREVPCKTKYVELLKIRNWLKYPQRFKVEIVNLSNGNRENLVWSCTGFKNLDLPALCEKDYNLNFFAYKTGNLRFHVSFINEETKEYIWYDITFKVVMCGPLEVIPLKCGVRQTLIYELKLDNPLNELVKYKLDTTSPEIHFENNTYEVEPNNVIYAKISFTPIHVREQRENLVAECSQLGIFPRELHLIGLPVQSGPPTTFETSLGASQTKIICVKNLSHLNATLTCKVNSEDFTVNEVENVKAGSEVPIKITHEPSEMTTTMATLNIESEEAGNFTFPLLGVCVKPLAKGPFVLKVGSTLNINFKNVFKKAKEFYMYVDNPAFLLKSVQENIVAKGEINITVGMQKMKYLEKLTESRERGIDPRFPFMGQLVVECFNPYVKWQFYLKGIVDS